MKKIALLLTAALLLPLMLASCSGGKYDTVMEYNGLKLTEDKYYYWLSTFKRNILSYYSDAYDSEEFWGAKYDETRTVEEYFTEVINSRIASYLIAESIYKNNRLKLDSDVKDKISDDIKEKIEYYGSRSELNRELETLMLNIDTLKEVYTVEEKYKCVYNYLFGEGGAEEIGDKAILDYYADNYSRIKYIVFYLTGLETDENGEYKYDSEGQLITHDLTAEELAEKQKRISECKEKLDAGEDIDALAEIYSEYDTSAYVNGFFVSSNELETWGADIIVAVNKANVGDTVRVDEEYAVYLIQKFDLTDFGDLSEADTEQLKNLSVYATNQISDAYFAELAKDILYNTEILSKYKLSEIKANPFYSI